MIIIRSNRVILRDRLLEDLERVLFWETHGEHLVYDAPWENRSNTDELRSEFIKRCESELPQYRGSAIIATEDNFPIGTLNRYYKKDNKFAPYIGISIKDDDYLNKGFGSEAFRLWLDYQFSNPATMRVGTETWSLNPRAIRLIEKSGFKLEGLLREFREWDGERIDALIYGILRREWESMPTSISNLSPIRH
jgi:RimJ/RimL family protein N-acetyltransferase